jgi:hypothetical protein
MILVFVGVTAALFAIGELMLSTPASRIPRAEAHELVEEALAGLNTREQKKRLDKEIEDKLEEEVHELENELQRFQLARSVTGSAFTPQDYVLSFPTDVEPGLTLQRELDESKEAHVNGEEYEFTCLQARVALYMIEKQHQRRKNK